MLTRDWDAHALYDYALTYDGTNFSVLDDLTGADKLYPSLQAWLSEMMGCMGEPDKLTPPPTPPNYDMALQVRQPKRRSLWRRGKKKPATGKADTPAPAQPTLVAQRPIPSMAAPEDQPSRQAPPPPPSQTTDTTETSGTLGRSVRIPGWMKGLAAAIVVVGAGALIAVMWLDHASAPQPHPSASSRVSEELHAAGEGFACSAKRHDTHVECVGQNNHGQLGSGTPAALHDHTITLASGVDDLQAGKDFACALTGTTVVCWGDNRWKQVADTADPLMPPTKVAIKGTPLELVTGVLHGCARTASQVWCWGANNTGQLGLAKAANQASHPNVVPDVAKPSRLWGSAFHTCAQVNETSLKCWGSNLEGRIRDDGPDVVGPTIVERDRSQR